jgi:hypothetical protein
LVIIGIDRYEKELDRQREREPVVAAQPEAPVGKRKKNKLERAEGGKKFPEIFLEKIRNWFDEQNE